MSETASRPHRIRHPRHFFVDGVWAEPSSSGTIDVVDSATEEVFLTVARAEAADIADAVSAARHAFDTGPWRAWATPNAPSS